VDRLELPDPLVEVLEERAVQLGLLDFILGAAEDIVEVAALGVALQQLGERQLAEEGIFDEGIPRAVEIGIPQVGQDDVLVFAQVFFDLFQVRPGIQLVAAQLLGVVAREQRLQLQQHRRAAGLRQDEINVTDADVDLRKRHRAHEILDQSPE